MNKKYKIAVIGETKVGKTVFFASYFYQVRSGKGKYPVIIKNQASDDSITNIINRLFNEHKTVGGTEERIDYSFSIDSLGMDIELFDIQGSFTSNRDNWDISEVSDDLASADGLILFISGYDVMTNRLDSLRIGSLMIDAISKVREHKEGNIKGRSDVPICFIFTKCDKIPDVSVDMLEENISATLQAAKQEHKFGNIFTEKFYKKGSYVKSYATQSMGKWQDDETPPLDYEPVNVLEPMEELFQTMAASRASYSKKLATVLTTGLALVLLAGGGFLFWMDYSEWQNFSHKVINASNNRNYEQAISDIDNYTEPSSLAPQFIRINRRDRLRKLRRDVYTDYEITLFAPLDSALSKIDYEKFPDVDEVFLENNRNVMRYLAVPYFAEINPEHYDRVREVTGYFAVGLLMNPYQNSSPDDEIQLIIRSLNYEVPKESWKDKIQNNIDTLLRHWCETIPADAEPSVYQHYIDQAGALLNHPKLSLELAEYISNRINTWHREMDESWRQLGEKWVKEAYDVSPEDGVRFLAEHMANRLNPTAEKMLKDAEVNLYNNIVNQALSEYADDIDALQALLNKFPAMTDEARERIYAQKAVLVGLQQENVINDIRSSKSIADLAGMARTLGGEAKIGEISKTIENTLQSLIDREFDKIDSQVRDMINNNSFAEAQQFIIDRSNAIKRDIRRFANSDSNINGLDAKVIELTDELMKHHLSFCKQSFTSRKTTKSKRDIVACINDLKEFITLWSASHSSEQWNEVRMVINFLETIQGGIKGNLLIVEGNFEAAVKSLIKNAAGSWYTFDTNPDMQIKVTVNTNLYSSPVINDKKQPVFNFAIPITWSVEMGTIEFEGIDVDFFSDNEGILTQKIDPSGFKGYERLTGTLQDSGNSLVIRFEPEVGIPKCPW